MLVTADDGSTGCVWHAKMIGTPGERFGLQSWLGVLPLMQILPIMGHFVGQNKIGSVARIPHGGWHHRSRTGATEVNT